MWNELKCIAECSKRISKSLLKKSYVKCRANRSRVKIKKKINYTKCSRRAFAIASGAEFTWSLR